MKRGEHSLSASSEDGKFALKIHQWVLKNAEGDLEESAEPAVTITGDKADIEAATVKASEILYQLDHGHYAGPKEFDFSKDKRKEEVIAAAEEIVSEGNVEQVGALVEAIVDKDPEDAILIDEATGESQVLEKFFSESEKKVAPAPKVKKKNKKS